MLYFYVLLNKQVPFCFPPSHLKIFIGRTLVVFRFSWWWDKWRKCVSVALCWRSGAAIGWGHQVRPSCNLCPLFCCCKMMYWPIKVSFFTLLNYRLVTDRQTCWCGFCVSTVIANVCQQRAATHSYCLLDNSLVLAHMDFWGHQLLKKTSLNYYKRNCLEICLLKFAFAAIFQ